MHARMLKDNAHAGEWDFQKLQVFNKSDLKEWADLDLGSDEIAADLKDVNTDGVPPAGGEASGGGEPPEEMAGPDESYKIILVCNEEQFDVIAAAIKKVDQTNREESLTTICEEWLKD